MKRKYVIILFLLLLQIPIFSQKMGSWKAFFSYSNCEQIVQTEELIFCVSKGSLFYIDKELESIKALTKIITESFTFIWCKSSAFNLLLVCGPANTDDFCHIFIG